MPKCPICGNLRSDESFIETYVSSFNNQEYKLYSCDSCYLEWWEPLKIIPCYYEQEVEKSYAAFHIGLREKIGKNHEMFFKFIPVKSGRLLDIGCGDGVFLKEARRAGYEVWGIDFDSKSIKVCKEKWGLENTFAMSLEEFAKFADKDGLKFDVITFFEVLEHQDRPREFLETVKKLLKPGGWIAGSVPNRERLFVKMDRKYFTGDKPPHHFLWFSKNSLLRCFANLGYGNLSVKSVDRRLRDYSPFIDFIVLGSLGPKLKRCLKEKLVADKHIAEAVDLESISKLKDSNSFLSESLLVVKRLRNLIYSPICMVLYLVSALKDEGPCLYFQGYVD
ncbi:MAG: class I SAM-dependent methyltransferase [Synergistetes bacterium]|nr:class I SAM-dependent methyltransferase [Synergistota bacterium]MDW8192722.1 class I SAM-dependent methyltransferase [Synergistota bacterium]